MRLSLAVAALVVAGAAEPARADAKLDAAVAKAEAQLAKGKEDEAVKILQKAAAQAPKDPEPALVLAQFLARLGKLEDAGASLTRASELSASASPAVKARVLAARSSMALRMGGAAEALALAQQAVQADGGASSLSALARAQARLGLPAARETAERAVKGGTSSAAATSPRETRSSPPIWVGRRRPPTSVPPRSSLAPRSRRAASHALSRPRARWGPLSRPRAPRPRPTLAPARPRPRSRSPTSPRIPRTRRARPWRRPAGRHPGAEEPAREAHAGPRIREPRTAHGSREQLRTSGCPRPVVAGAAGGRARAAPAPGRFRRGQRRIRSAVRRGEVVGRGSAPPRPAPPAQGGLERREGRARLGRGRASRPRRGPGRARYSRLQRG
jgi:hypothetical protein